AVDVLCERSPVTRARLVEAPEQGGPCWQYQPRVSGALQEIALASSAPEAVLAHAGRLVASPSDPVHNDPIRFHLLHRPAHRAVLLVQYNHTLMDYRDTVPLLRQIDRLYHEPDGASATGDVDANSVLWQHYRRFGRARRRDAFLRALEWPRLLRG